MLEPHGMAATTAAAAYQQGSASSSQKHEVSSETVLVQNADPDGSLLSAAAATFGVLILSPDAVWKSPGIIVPREANEIHRGQSVYRLLNPLPHQKCTDSCRHGQLTFLYSADEGSPCRPPYPICPVAKAAGPLQLLRSNSSPLGRLAASSSMQSDYVLVLDREVMLSTYKYVL